jgi:glycosyltransferase involved in cell wall biosynthesis
MNILLVHQYYQEKNDPGGLRWNEMTRIWAEKGHTITVIAGMTHYTKGLKNVRYKKKYFFTDQFAENIKVIRTHVSEKYNRNYTGRIWAYFSFVFSSIYAGVFKARGHYDVMIVSSPPLSVGIPAYILSRFKRVPLIFEVRDLWPESAIETGILKNKFMIRRAYWFESFIYKKAKLINVLTPSFMQSLLTKKNVPKNKLIMIPNAADFRLSDELLQNFDRKQLRQSLGIDDKLVIIYVGAHGVANHLIQVIETCDILRNEPVHFLLVGDGMQKKYLIDEAGKRNLPNLTFIDSVSKPEALKYIIASDIGTSVLKKTDTFKTVYSNKTFDYMSCKKPILMAIDGISKELIEQSGAGLFVEPEQPDDFAAKVRTYLKQPELISIQGNKGYAFAKQHFDRITLADEYLNHIEHLVNTTNTSK